MFTEFEIIIDETIINSLFANQDRNLVYSFLRFIDYRRIKSKKRYIRIETTPLILKEIERKLKDSEPELFYILKNFICENSIASEEEGLTMEQEIIDLVNNSLPITPDVCLITEKSYSPSKDKVGNVYELRRDVVVKTLSDFMEFMIANDGFKEFLDKNPQLTSEQLKEI